MNLLPPNRRCAFSLVEVVLALAILAFSLVSVAALIPIGLRSNQSSVQEARAADLLALLDADLRNSYPVVPAGGASSAPQSLIFKLPLPYTINTLGREVINSAIPANAFYTTGVTDYETPVGVGTVPPPPFQASVIYTSAPTTSVTPIQARLVISWPVNASATANSLTQGQGYLEAFETFPAP